MFSVHGVSGRVFSGTLEEMGRVRGLVRSRPEHPVATDGSRWQLDAVPGSVPWVNDKAVRAYRAMLPPEIERGPLYHAGQIMQRKVVSIGTHFDLGQAWETLQSHRIHQAPVLDDAAQLVGIVSKTDLLTAFNTETGKMMEAMGRQVKDVMTTPVISVEAVTDIRRIATAMLTHHINGVPVTGEQGRLVGYVSRSDVLRAVVKDPPLSLWR